MSPDSITLGVFYGETIKHWLAFIVGLKINHLK